MSLSRHLAALEVEYIRQALAQAGGAVPQAAKLLKMRRTALASKMRKFDLESS